MRDRDLFQFGKFFRTHPHLALYVLHIEIRVTVWGLAAPLAPWSVDTGRQYPPHALCFRPPYVAASTCTSSLITQTTLADLFRYVQSNHAEARILTLRDGASYNEVSLPAYPQVVSQLAVLPKIQVFHVHGTWEYLQISDSWATLSSALPSVQEWHCSSVKVDVYRILSAAVPNFSARLRHLVLNVESMSGVHSSYAVLDQEDPHPCNLLAEAAPHLESLTVVGILCSDAFIPRKSHPTPPSEGTLKSIDLTINTTRCYTDEELEEEWEEDEYDENEYDDDEDDEDEESSIMQCIGELEETVYRSIVWLGLYRSLENIRIDTRNSPTVFRQLGLYFEFKGQECRGLWNDRLVAALKEARPEASYVALEEELQVRRDHTGKVVDFRLPQTRLLN